MPVEAGPEPRHRVAEQVPDALRCDVELRHFLAEVSHQAITADGDSAGVSYVQSQHNWPAPASPLTELANLQSKCPSRPPGLAAGPLRHSSIRPHRQLTRLPSPAATPGARAHHPAEVRGCPFFIFRTASKLQRAQHPPVVAATSGLRPVLGRGRGVGCIFGPPPAPQRRHMAPFPRLCSNSTTKAAEARPGAVSGRNWPRWQHYRKHHHDNRNPTTGGQHD